MFRNVTRPVYDDLMSQQLGAAAEQAPSDDAALDRLLAGTDIWTVA